MANSTDQKEDENKKKNQKQDEEVQVTVPSGVLCHFAISALIEMVAPRQDQLRRLVQEYGDGWAYAVSEDELATIIAPIHALGLIIDALYDAGLVDAEMAATNGWRTMVERSRQQDQKIVLTGH